MAVLQRFGKDVVAVVVIQDKQVEVSRAGGLRESASLVTIGLARMCLGVRVGEDRGIAEVFSSWRIFSWELVSLKGTGRVCLWCK